MTDDTGDKQPIVTPFPYYPPTIADVMQQLAEIKQMLTEMQWEINGIKDAVAIMRQRTHW